MSPGWELAPLGSVRTQMPAGPGVAGGDGARKSHQPVSGGPQGPWVTPAAITGPFGEVPAHRVLTMAERQGQGQKRRAVPPARSLCLKETE